MNAIIKYFSDVAGGFISLLKGMRITGKHFARSYKEIITQQYPDNKDSLRFADRYRAQLYMVHNEQNEMRCDACQTCETVCPNGSIEVIWFREEDPETGKREKCSINMFIISACVLLQFMCTCLSDRSN